MKLAWALLRNAGTLFGASLAQDAADRAPEPEQLPLLLATSSLAASAVEVRHDVPGGASSSAFHRPCSALAVQSGIRHRSRVLHGVHPHCCRGAC